MVDQFLIAKAQADTNVKASVHYCVTSHEFLPDTEEDVTKKIRDVEKEQITARRKNASEKTIDVDNSDHQEAVGHKTGDRTDLPIVGVSLSGGGIRSASVCLGALQAIYKTGGIEGIDYLSTVSGGGYIGCSLTAGLWASKGKFPFFESSEYRDTDAVRHIRDHSKYMIPRGLSDVVLLAAVFLRGLLVNAILTAPFLFFFAFSLLALYPRKDDLPLEFSLGSFRITLCAVIVTASFLLLWAAWNTIQVAWDALRTQNKDAIAPTPANPREDGSSELWGAWGLTPKVLFFIVAVLAFCELQPHILREMWVHKSTPYWIPIINWLAVASLTLLIASKLSGGFENFSARALDTWGWIKKIGAFGSMWLTGLIIPVFIWSLGLQLAFAGQIGRNETASDLLKYLAKLPPPILSNLAIEIPGHISGKVIVWLLIVVIVAAFAWCVYSWAKQPPMQRLEWAKALILIFLLSSACALDRKSVV
jgi:hypothetical protein